MKITAAENLSKRLHNNILERLTKRGKSTRHVSLKSLYIQVLEALIAGAISESETVSDEYLPADVEHMTTSAPDDEPYVSKHIPNDWGNSVNSHWTLWQELENLSIWFRSNHMDVKEVLKIRHKPDIYVDALVSFYRKSAGIGSPSDTLEQRWVRLPVEGSTILNWALAKNILSPSVLKWYAFKDDGLSTNFYDMPNYVLSPNERKVFSLTTDWDSRRDVIRDELIALAKEIKVHGNDFVLIENESSFCRLWLKDDQGQMHKAGVDKAEAQSLFRYVVMNPSKHQGLLDILNLQADGLDPDLPWEWQLDIAEIPFPADEVGYERVSERPINVATTTH